MAATVFGLLWYFFAFLCSIAGIVISVRQGDAKWSACFGACVIVNLYAVFERLEKLAEGA